MTKLDLGRVYGKSAYEIALDNGFKGTEKEWLDSLKATGGHLLNDFLPTPSEQLAFGNNNGQFVIEDEKRRYIFRKQLVYKYIPKVLEIPDSSSYTSYVRLRETYAPSIHTVKYGENKYNVLAMSDMYCATYRQEDMSLKEDSDTLAGSKGAYFSQGSITGISNNFYVFGSHVFGSLKRSLDPVFKQRHFYDKGSEKDGSLTVRRLNGGTNYLDRFNSPVSSISDENDDIKVPSTNGSKDFTPTFIKTNVGWFLIMQEWTLEGDSRYSNIVRIYRLEDGGSVWLNIPLCNTDKDINSNLAGLNMLDFNNHIGIIRSEFLETDLEGKGFTPIIVDSKEFVKKCWSFGRTTNAKIKTIAPKNVYDIARECLIDGLTSYGFAKYLNNKLIEDCKKYSNHPRDFIYGWSGNFTQTYRGHVFTKEVALLGVQKMKDGLRSCLYFYNSKTKQVIRYYVPLDVTAHDINGFDFDFNIFSIDYKDGELERKYIVVEDEYIREIENPYSFMNKDVLNNIFKYEVSDTTFAYFGLFYTLDKHKFPFTSFNTELYPRFDYFHDDVGFDEDGFLIKVAHCRDFKDGSLWFSGLGKKWDYVLTDVTDKEVL